MTHVSGFPLSRELVIKKILIIRFSSLGDIILTTPLLKILKQDFPESEIDYCTKKSYADIIRYNPAINKVLEVSDDMDFAELSLLKSILRKSKYDLILDLHNNLRTFYLKFFLRFSSKILVFKKYSFRKFLLVNFKINIMKDLTPIMNRYIKVLHSIVKTETMDNIKPGIFTNDYAKEEAEKLISNLKIPQKSKLICIVPSSKHFTKTYPAENFAELINKFNKDEYSFLLIGKGNDEVSIKKIKSLTGENVYDLCDKLTLLELTEVMKKCDLVISGDTGPMHIAEATGTPLIMMAGSSVKEFGFFPSKTSPPTPLLLQRRGENNTILEVDGLKCRPCSHIGRESCPKGHFKCMKNITADMVYREVLKIIN